MEKREVDRLLCGFLAGRKIPNAGLEKMSPTDWDCLVERALRFKVGGMLYRGIKSGAFPNECASVDVINRLKEAYRNQATQNATLFIDAARVLKSLADIRLPVIALKGLALVKNIYGDIALRPMADIDFLVKEEDVVRAGRTLLTLGYRQVFPAWESNIKRHHHLPPFTSKSGTIIELHWDIVPVYCPIKVDINGLWERACLIKEDDAAVRVFSLEDLFLHLCIHACFHLQTGIDLIPFCDMAGLIRTFTDKIDWQIVIERATRWGTQKGVYLMLLLVRELLGVSAPDKIISEIKPGDYQPIFFDKALEQIFDANPSGQLFRKRIGILVNIKKTNSIKGMVLALLKGAFPSRKYMASIYPIPLSSPKIYLYYFVRLGRLSAYYFLALFHLLRRDQAVLKEYRDGNWMSAVFDWMFSS